MWHPWDIKYHRQCTIEWCMIWHFKCQRIVSTWDLARSWPMWIWHFSLTLYKCLFCVKPYNMNNRDVVCNYCDKQYSSWDEVCWRIGNSIKFILTNMHLGITTLCSWILCLDMLAPHNNLMLINNVMSHRSCTSHT